MLNQQDGVIHHTRQRSKGAFMNRSVLVVEDDAIQRAAIVHWLADAGYHVVGVGHPRQALQAASFRQFSVVVLDLSLPEIDGIELMRRLQRCQVAAHYIITSGFDYSKRHASAIGAHACLQKPFSRAQFEAAVAKAYDAALATPVA